MMKLACWAACMSLCVASLICGLLTPSDLKRMTLLVDATVWSAASFVILALPKERR